MPSTIHAIGYHRSLPIDDPESLIDLEIPSPTPGPRDLIVRPEAVSVNPVDVKVRSSAQPEGAERVLGFDASGTVVAVGSDVSLFQVGDEVFYAGSIDRPGTNADLHAVNERIVGHKPARLGHAEAAAMPLTSITAWESLFDRLRVSELSNGTLLVLGAAGGVGSILIQLARQLTGLTVIATSGRPETSDWVTKMGAQHVVDHRDDLAGQLRAIAPDGLDYVFTSRSDGQIPLFAEVVRPFGEIVAIDDPPGLDIYPLKTKSLTWHWESMFARSSFQTPDVIEQHYLLDTVGRLLDEGILTTTLTTTLVGFDAEHLREAHRLVESGATIGKVVVSRS
jgi:NADPH2:quinone reductase